MSELIVPPTLAVLLTADTGPLNVNPGLQLNSKAAVVGENATTGDYIFLTNFSLNNPGSMHTAQTLSFAGKCANEDTANLGTATLTIPASFVFDVTGRSPAVHVFVGQNVTGFDLHYPQGFTEVSIPKPTVTPNGDGSYTAAVDLSSLGTIPTTDVIYMRAHTKWGSTTAPAAGTYTFTDTAAATAFNGDSSLGGFTTSDSYPLTSP